MSKSAAQYVQAACTALLASVLLSACLPSLEGNEPRDARRETPSGFGGPTSSGTSGQAPPLATSAVAGTGLGARKRAQFFDDPDLRALIDSALENNQELNVRLQEIIIREAEVGARKGEYLPKVEAKMGAGVEKASAYTREGTVDEAFDLPEHMGDFAFGLAGSWEIDVWKKLRNAAQAANYRYLSSIEGKNFFVTELVAEIARSYYELIALDRQLEVLERNIAIQTDALEVVKVEKEAARVTQLAVQRFEAEVLKNRSRLYDIGQARVRTENRINFLLGRFPSRVERDAHRLDQLAPDSIPTGLPSDLLDTRPDVRQAALDLEAAKLDVKVTKAAFYPSLSVDAGVGYRSFNMEHLVTTPESLVYNAAGHLTAPLLNRKAIAAQYRTANAQQIQAVFQFERTLLQAYTDVANQLAALQNLKQTADLQTQQVAMLTDSVESSNVLFQAARADYMEVLLTRRDKLDAEMELIETKMRVRLSMVNLYQALGGGWN